MDAHAGQYESAGVFISLEMCAQTINASAKLTVQDYQVSDYNFVGRLMKMSRQNSNDSQKVRTEMTFSY